MGLLPRSAERPHEWTLHAPTGGRAGPGVSFRGVPDPLVIDTRNFDAKRRWRNTTDGARLVERLPRVDADTLSYEFTVTDPETGVSPVSPWTASVPLALNPSRCSECACYEGNYSMPLMLGGQRNIDLGASNEP